MVAVLVPRAGMSLEPDALIAAVKGRIASFKVPKRCIVVDALPCNTMCKEQKNLLRETSKNQFAG